MPGEGPTVTVVLDRDFGKRPDAPSIPAPAWIVESECNTRLALRVWQERPGSSHLDGLTTFRAGEGDAPEQMFLAQIDSIDLHHGHYSSDPPYAEIVSIGAVLTPSIRAALNDISFDDHIPTAEGFTARRSRRAEGTSRQ